MEFYSVAELPSRDPDRVKILESIGKQNFLLVYDFLKSKSILGFNNQSAENTICRINKNIPGIRFGRTDCSFRIWRKIILLFRFIGK